MFGYFRKILTLLSCMSMMDYIDPSAKQTPGRKLFGQHIVKIFFVVHDSSDTKIAYSDMNDAHKIIEEISFDDMANWLDEDSCFRFQQDKLEKEHLFVFDKFAGKAFEFISNSKATVVGPRCLISCFMYDIPIQPGPYPVMTNAMWNMNVCTSGLEPEAEAQIRKMVMQMGGFYSNDLTGSCTHLVTCTVNSKKYHKAAEIKLKIMHPTWIRDVWEHSLNDMVFGNDYVFAKHKLPIFYSLNVSSTSLTLEKDNNIKKLIEKNGGTFIGPFQVDNIDCLILEKDDSGSENFLVAVRCKKRCLTPAWIFDSVDEGYALPTSPYEIKIINSLTHTNDDSSLGKSICSTKNIPEISRKQSQNLNRLPTTDLCKISCKERQVYSQKLQQSEYLEQSHDYLSKPIDKGHSNDDLSTFSGNNLTLTPAAGNYSNSELMSVKLRAIEFEANRMRHQGRPIFAISCVIDQQRASLIQKIVVLGGQLSNKPYEYDENCTHILCRNPNRVEKILSGIAAGKWLLSTKYIEDSSKAGHFLNEEMYEWFNPCALDLPTLEPNESTVAKAAFNWRKRIVCEESKRNGAFTGFRVLLMTPNKEPFTRIIQSGGGYVIDMDPPFKVKDLNVTHCFVDTKKTKIRNSDHRMLSKAGIAVMTIMYLNAHLTNETMPDPDKYRLQL